MPCAALSHPALVLLYCKLAWLLPLRSHPICFQARYAIPHAVLGLLGFTPPQPCTLFDSPVQPPPTAALPAKSLPATAPSPPPCNCPVCNCPTCNWPACNCPACNKLKLRSPFTECTRITHLQLTSKPYLLLRSCMNAYHSSHETPLFVTPTGSTAPDGVSPRHYGWFRGDTPHVLGANVVWCCVLFGWTMGMMYPFFWILKKFDMLRISREEELVCFHFHFVFKRTNHFSH